MRSGISEMSFSRSCDSRRLLPHFLNLCRSSARRLVLFGPDLIEAREVIAVEYDGTNYHGFQLQAGANTIQAELEKAIEVLAVCIKLASAEYDSAKK